MYGIFERCFFVVFFFRFIYCYFGCGRSLLLLGLFSGCRSRGYCLVVGLGLLIAVASLIENGLQGAQALTLLVPGSRAQAR